MCEMDCIADLLYAKCKCVGYSYENYVGTYIFLVCIQ